MKGPITKIVRDHHLSRWTGRAGRSLTELA
jgi:hypothetical protein